MKLKAILNKVLSYLPEQLPVGMAAHDTWASAVITLSGLPDNDSTRFALATMILHADAKNAFLPKQYFVTRLLKGAANQVAGGVMQDLKQKQADEMAKAQAAAEAAKLVADTTPTEGDATNEQQQEV